MDQQNAATEAGRLLRAGKVPTVVEYLTPGERANDAAWRSVKATAAAVLIVCGPLLLSFLAQGDFSRKAVITIATALGMALINVGVQWALKYREATNDDAKHLDAG